MFDPQGRQKNRNIDALNQKWKEENHRKSSSVRMMVAGEKRQSGQQILRLTSNHVSTQRLWNSWEQGKDLIASSSSILIRHTLQHSSSLLPPPPWTLGYSKASHFSRPIFFFFFFGNILCTWCDQFKRVRGVCVEETRKNGWSLLRGLQGLFSFMDYKVR